MALAGELAKYIGNELVKTGGKSALSSLVPSVASKVGTELATKAGAGAVNKIIVSQAPSVASKLPVLTGSAGKIPLYRGIKAETPELLQQYIDDMMNPNIKPRTYEGSAYGEGYYFTPFRDGAEGYASNDLSKPYQAVLEISPTKGRFLGINKANQNRPVDFTIRAENRGVSGGKSLGVGQRDYENYLKRNGILGNRVKAGLDDSIYVISDNDALKGMKVVGSRVPGGDWEYNSSLSNILPSGSKVKFDKDLNISSIEKPSLGRGWFASNENNPHIAKAIKQSGADKYLGEPKINYSLADEPDITLYHGTPNKFEDFDDALPSVWFSNSDKNLRDTGLSIKGGQPMNIMERKLPKDLKIADEELADRLTKQQLQDRGYAGVAYTERGPNGDETYYEIFKPNKTLKKTPKVPQSKIELSPQQQEFFKDSVVRDENGDLIPMYHGTRGDFTVFGDKNPNSSSNSKSGVGYWFTPNEEGAKNFANSIWYGDGQPKAMKTYLNIKNPKVYESVDNSKAVEALRKELDKIELKSKTMSKPSLYYKNMYDYSVAYNMVNQGDKDMAIKWLADKSSYDEKTATELIEEIDNMKMLEDEKKKIQDEISELKYGDAYERFRTDIYKVDGQTAEDANVGGIGMALRDDSSVQKYVDNLKAEGYDGIIIKGTNYDADTMGGINDQYVAFDPEQIKLVDNRKPTKHIDIRYAIAAGLGLGTILAPYMNNQKKLDNYN